MYSLHVFFGDNFPPLLKNQNGDYIFKMRNFTFEDGKTREVKYIIGSTQFVDANYNSATPETAEYFPDPNWDLYPKEEFPMALYKHSVTRAYTDYNYDDNQYLYYSPPEDYVLLGYSRLLREHILSSLTLLTPRKQVEKRLLLNYQELKKLEEEKKSIETQIKKLNTQIPYQQRADRRAGVSVSQDLNQLMSELNTLTLYLSNIAERMHSLIIIKKSEEKDLKQLKSKPKLKKK